MREISEFGTDSTDKCSAIIDVSILSTLGEHQRQKATREKKTGSRRAESGTNDSNAKRDPLPQFLVTDLNRLTFQSGGIAYRADDTEHTSAWEQFVSERANSKQGIDWSDLEERVHFLNQLHAYCLHKDKPFPLSEQPEKINEEA